MTPFELEELNAVPEWQSVLAAYRECGAAARAQTPEFDGWLSRLRNVPGVAEARLPLVHGRLMALGFLRFQVGSRAVGLQYQLTPEGRQALDGEMAESHFATDSSAPEQAEEPDCVFQSA